MSLLGAFVAVIILVFLGHLLYDAILDVFWRAHRDDRPYDWEIDGL